MATLLGVSRSMISRWESGREEPRRMVILSYALICQVPLPWLDRAAGGNDECWMEDNGVYRRKLGSLPTGR